MAKINIKFNNVEYKIDDSALASAIANLVSYLSTEMSGSGETINLGGTSYNVDSTKLAAAKNDFVSHLETIAGEGYKVTVGGVQFGVDSTKVANVIAELETVFDNLSNEGDEPDNPTITRAAGLYETGTDNMVTSWDDLIANGDIVVNDGAISVGSKLPDNLPEKNEYGFYFGVPYSGEGAPTLMFYADGSFEMAYEGETESFPSGSSEYSEGSVYVVPLDISFEVLNDGYALDAGGMSITLDQVYSIVGDLVLPNDNSITIVPTNAFYMQNSLTGITIPNSVESIEEYSFSYCDNLTSVVIPDSVTSIGAGAFSECYNLTNVVISNNVTSIEPDTFTYCESLTSVVIPNSVESIGMQAFLGCMSLTSVVIPDGVTSIGGGAFNYCDNLTSVVIGKGVTSINRTTFTDCNSLTSITVDENNTTYQSIDGNLYTKDGKELIQYAIGKTETQFIIPNGVTKIGNEAFRDCDNLISLVIPISVTQIGGSVMYKCDNFTRVYYKGTEAQWSAITIYLGNEKLTNATIYYNYHD